MTGLLDIEERRRARREAGESARAKQLELDLAALDAAEEEHGYDRVVRYDVKAWKEGTPTLAVFRMPSAPEMKRFHAESKRGPDGKPGDAGAAGARVARVCVVYPTREVFDAMCEGDEPSLNANACGGELLTKAIGAVANEGKG